MINNNNNNQLNIINDWLNYKSVKIMHGVIYNCLSSNTTQNKRIIQIFLSVGK